MSKILDYLNEQIRYHESEAAKCREYGDLDGAKFHEDMARECREDIIGIYAIQ